jgi:hypothetical protein
VPHHEEYQTNEALIAEGALIDGQLAKDLILRSQNAVCKFWDQNLQSFWRSTEHRIREQERTKPLLTQFFPTVSFRCTEALLDVFTTLPEWTSQDATAVLKLCVPVVSAKKLKDMHSALDVDNAAGIHNPFTTALYVATVSKGFLGKAPSVSAKSVSNLRTAVQSLKKSLEPKSVKEGDQPHPFIQFHALRAILGYLTALQDRVNRSDVDALIHKVMLGVRANIERLLAQHTLGRLAPSEAVALLFSAGSLALAERDEDQRYILSALQVGFEAQDATGCWPLGRVIQLHKEEEKANIEISTYEIAWVATCILLLLGKKDRKLLRSVRVISLVQKLVLAARYAQASLIELPTETPPRIGWCSDHPYGKPLIESWTSANVLQAAVSLHELVESVNRELILGTFVTVDPFDDDWPSWLRWKSYKRDSEPEDDKPILDYIDNAIVKRIRIAPRMLPSADEESVSMLLFGPPGTSKTTLVKAMADGLGWPVVMLSPGDFIKEGLEYIEAQARSVFDRLQRLSRAVVLFDECDELFRNRNPSDEAEQMRGITAFVTASMLPKLQELHDRGRVVFCICTNKFETLDPAVKRGGRIDHIIGVGPPQAKARLRIIQTALSSSLPFHDVLSAELSEATDRLTRSEIKRACKLVEKGSKLSNKDEAKTAARTAADRIRHASTITDQEYNHFKKSKEDFSRPVTEGGDL